MVLDTDFYKAELWFESVLNFYASKDDMPDKFALFQPVKDITDAIGSICTLYAQYPDDIIEFLKVSTNPFMSNDGFRADIINNLHLAAEESEQSGYNDMAEHLFFCVSVMKVILRCCGSVTVIKFGSWSLISLLWLNRLKRLLNLTVVRS